MPPDPSETLSIDDDALIKPFRFVLWVVWGALFVSLVGYVGVGELVALPGRPAPMEIVYVLGAVALGIAVAAPVIRGRLLPPTAPPGMPAMMSREQAQRALIPYFVAHLVTLALYESIGILGLIATLLVRDARYVLAFAAVAAAGMLVFRPSDERIRGTLRAAVTKP